MYMVRSAEGTAIVELDDEAAGKLVRSGCGRWREFNLTTCGKVQAYEVEVDQVLTIADGRMKIFFWKGTYVYKKARR